MNVHSIKVPSQCLKREIPVKVVVPDSPSGKSLLLLHGYDSDNNEWITKSSIIDRAQEFGAVLVAPSCGNMYYLDVQEPIGCFLGEELPLFVRKHFPVSTKRKDACIIGASMGGFGSLLLGSRFSNVYGKIASFGGTFIIHDVAIGNPGVLGNADPRFFHRVFGDLSTLEGSERDPLWHVHKAVEENRMPPVWLLCGINDILYQNNEKMYDTLSRIGVPVKLIRVSGGHNWLTWNLYLNEMMEWLINLP